VTDPIGTGHAANGSGALTEPIVTQVVNYLSRNNGVFTAPAAGTIASITEGEKGAQVVEITKADGSTVSETVPAGPTLLVKAGDSIEAGAPLTNDPNVGGFGQVDAEVVLQNPVRIYGLLAFLGAVALAQILLVLKKRQVEKVQAAEGSV
jgi:apocytochrome f